jgi:hypothetical protein
MFLLSLTTLNSPPRFRSSLFSTFQRHCVRSEMNECPYWDWTSGTRWEGRLTRVCDGSSRAEKDVERSPFDALKV